MQSQKEKQGGKNSSGRFPKLWQQRWAWLHPPSQCRVPSSFAPYSQLLGTVRASPGAAKNLLPVPTGTCRVPPCNGGEPKGVPSPLHSQGQAETGAVGILFLAPQDPLPLRAAGTACSACLAQMSALRINPGPGPGAKVPVPITPPCPAMAKRRGEPGGCCERLPAGQHPQGRTWTLFSPRCMAPRV